MVKPPPQSLLDGVRCQAVRKIIIIVQPRKCPFKVGMFFIEIRGAGVSIQCIAQKDKTISGQRCHHRYKNISHRYSAASHSSFRRPTRPQCRCGSGPPFGSHLWSSIYVSNNSQSGLKLNEQRTILAKTCGTDCIFTGSAFAVQHDSHMMPPDSDA